MFREFWKKRESFSAHLAWGAVVFFVGVVHGLQLETAFVLTIFAGSVWELGGEFITRQLVGSDADIRRPDPPVWKSRALDVVPWILGGGLAWILYP